MVIKLLLGFVLALYIALTVLSMGVILHIELEATRVTNKVLKHTYEKFGKVRVIRVNLLRVLLGGLFFPFYWGYYFVKFKTEGKIIWDK